MRQPFNGMAHLYEVIQVRLFRTQRLIEVNTNGYRLAANEPVLVRVHRNILLATTIGCRHRRVAEINSLPFVIRVATEEDRAIDAENANIEKHAQEIASAYAIAQNLQMKVLSADLSHDHKNITINFASDVRVDFRDMVAYLAGQLHLRVEMYQLGLRNGTGIICGLGSCGQLLCCGRFLGQFDPIAVKQLRAQGLATNPKRISGVCGRLYCCMSYEYCDYMRERRNLPKKGRRIFSRWGIGRVTDIDTLREEVVVTYENGETQRLTPHDFVPLTDEISARVEAGEYEFPLEPARFYLNRDASSCAEAEPRTSRAPRGETHGEAPLRRSAPARRDAHAAPGRPAPERSAPARPAPPARPEPPKPRRKTVMGRHKVPGTMPPGAPNGAIPPNAPSPSNTPAAPTPAAPPRHAPEPGDRPGIRVPRKVHARQANLEENMNQNAEMRRNPARPSRRPPQMPTQPPTGKK